MTIYLAGKITGDPDYRAKFLHFQFDLMRRRKDEDDKFINPAAAGLPQGLPPADYISITVPMLLAADAAAFLPDWKDSPGARIERAICEYINLPIMDFPDTSKSSWMNCV